MNPETEPELRQRQRIEQVRRLMRVWIEESEERIKQFMNEAGRQEATIALYELRLQELDDLERKLNRSKKAKA